MTKLFTLPGIPPNFSVLAAMSAGLLPANAQITNFGTGGPSATLLTDLSTGDFPGAGPVPSDVAANLPASALTFATPVGYGGD
jgi:hypothetical protein